MVSILKACGRWKFKWYSCFDDSTADNMSLFNTSPNLMNKHFMSVSYK